MGRRLAVILILALTAAPVWPLEYNITTTWNGGELDHDPVELLLAGSDDGQFLELKIFAPFFNDPKEPPGPPGQPFYGLWDYEVVEAFFLNDENQYLEVEVGPFGHHIVLLLNGERNTIRHSLPMEVNAELMNETWSGLARIPVEYLPKNVTRFNAYAIHGSGEKRVYESLYPAAEDAAAPDFHALQYFEDIDLSSVLPDHANAEMSQFWEDALQGLIRYQIKTKWNDVPVDHEPVEITLQGFEAGVEMNVTAPFFNDPAPEGEPGEPFYKLWDYEVVEMFFLNNNEEYLEVELGPWGQHLLLLLKGARNALKHSIPLDYIILGKTNPANGKPGQWKGSAMLPPGYFPPNVTRMNVYAIHGVEDNREYQALYPAPNNDPAYPVADFHRLELFRPIDFQFLLPNNSDYSKLWRDAITSGSSAFTLEEEEEEPVTVLGLGSVFHPTPSPFEPSVLDKTPDEISQVHEETASLRKPKPQLILADEQREQRFEEGIELFPSQAFIPSEGEPPKPHLLREGDREIENLNGASLQRIPFPQSTHFKDPVFGFHDTVLPIPHFEDERIRQGDSQFLNPVRRQRPSLFQGGRPSQSTSQFSTPTQFPLQTGSQPPTPAFFPSEGETAEVSPFQNERQSLFPISEQPHIQNQPHINQDQSTLQTQAQLSEQNIRQPELPSHFRPQEALDFQIQGVSSFHSPGQPSSQNQFQNQQPGLPNNVSPHFQETDQSQFQQTSQQQSQHTSQLPFQETSLPQFEESNQPQFHATSQPHFQETPPTQFLNPDNVGFQSETPLRFQGQGRPPIQLQLQDPSSPAQPAEFSIQNPILPPEHQSVILGSEASVIAPINPGDLLENVSPEIEQALLTLAEETPALPPPHPICFELGLVPDPNRCYAFHECVLEDGEWRMYSWRCRRGQIFDPVNVACIRGRCSRNQTRRRRVRNPQS